MITILLLIVSNIFMTLAWYGHLKFPHLPMVDRHLHRLEHRAHRIFIRRARQPHRLCARVQRRAAQDHPGDRDHLGVFAIFAAIVLKEPLGWRYLGAFACIVGAAAFMFAGRL